MSSEEVTRGADSSKRGESSTGEPREESTAEKHVVPATTRSEASQSAKQDTASKPQGKDTDQGSLDTKKPPSSSEKSEEGATAAASSPGSPQVVSSSSEQEERPRQVIAVSASKGPAAFFNLARKFLVTDEMCDLSALEGAIVSAVDAAHLLERSKLATIVRIQTSYVTVEPKRKRLPPSGAGAAQPSSAGAGVASASAMPGYPPPQPYAHAGLAQQHHYPGQQQGARGSAGAGSRELRRARIVITVKRTESYRQWLEENPVQAILAGDADESAETPPQQPPSSSSPSPDTAPPAAGSKQS